MPCRQPRGALTTIEMRRWFVGMIGSTIALAAGAQAPADAATEARQRYEREVAACNSGALAAPARDACVRAAGTWLDRTRGGPPVDAPLTTPDGRATVIAPPGTSLRSSDAPPSNSPPDGAAGTSTTPDGRATIVQP